MKLLTGNFKIKIRTAPEVMNAIFPIISIFYQLGEDNSG